MLGVPLWCSGLRIQHGHYSGLGHCYGTGLTPGPGMSIHLRCSTPPQKKLDIKKKNWGYLQMNTRQSFCSIKLQMTVWPVAHCSHTGQNRYHGTDGHEEKKSHRKTQISPREPSIWQITKPQLFWKANKMQAFWGKKIMIWKLYSQLYVFEVKKKKIF